jgi:hypothetical protein
MRDAMRLIVFRCATAFPSRAFQLVQPLAELIQRPGLQALPHDPESVADSRAHLTVNVTGCHCPDRLSQRYYDLVQGAKVA